MKEKGKIHKDLTKLMGKGVQIKENSKSIAKKEKDFFIDLLELLPQLDTRTYDLIQYGIDTVSYEEPYHNLIEGFIYIHYGSVAGEVINWWLSEKYKGHNNDLTIKIGEGIEVTINTPTQLYKAVKKINNSLNA